MMVAILTTNPARASRPARRGSEYLRYGATSAFQRPKAIDPNENQTFRSDFGVDTLARFAKRIKERFPQAKMGVEVRQGFEKFFLYVANGPTAATRLSLATNSCSVRTISI